MRILICDDDEALVSMMRFKFTKENLGEVIVAPDGREAKNQLRGGKFDLVITDITCPFTPALSSQLLSAKN